MNSESWYKRIGIGFARQNDCWCTPIPWPLIWGEVSNILILCNPSLPNRRGVLDLVHSAGLVTAGRDGIVRRTPWLRRGCGDQQARTRARKAAFALITLIDLSPAGEYAPPL